MPFPDDPTNPTPALPPRATQLPAGPAAGILVAPWLLGLGVVLMSLDLRPGATAVGPVLAEVRADLTMGSGTASLLTALPGLAFAVFGVAAPRLGRVLGEAGGLAVGCLAMAVGLGGRALADDPTVFLLLSLLGLGGAGIGNVLVPAAVKHRFPLHSAQWMSLYITVMAVGSIFPQLIGPLLMGAGHGWRLGLGVWGVLGAVAMVPWAVVGLGERARRRAADPGPTMPGRAAGSAPGTTSAQSAIPGAAPDPSAASADSAAGADTATSAPTVGAGVPAHSAVGLGQVATSPTARWMAAFFGLQSLQAYVVFGWLAQIYRDAGLGLDVAAGMLAVFNACGVVGGLLMPTVVARMADLRPVALGLVSLLGVGYMGLWLAPAGAPWLWALVLGVSGFCFPMALALITARTRDYRVTAALSGFSQSVGYALASLGPLVVGWIHAATGGWVAPLWFLLGTAVLMAVAGWRATAHTVVDDELA